MIFPYIINLKFNKITSYISILLLKKYMKKQYKAKYKL